MNNNFDKYVAFTESIFSRVPLMKTAQIFLLLNNYLTNDDEYIKEMFGKTDDLKTKKIYIQNIIFELQRSNKLFLSPDGWAMSKGMYKRLVSNRFERHIETNNTYRLSNMDDICSVVYPDVISALWIVADMFPLSKNFIISNYPWDIMFEVPPDSKNDARLFQITSFHKNNLNTHVELIRGLVESDNKEMREAIRRIAIVDEEIYKERIPYLGFFAVCMIDDTHENHYRIIEKRNKQTRWKEYGI